MSKMYLTRERKEAIVARYRAGEKPEALAKEFSTHWTNIYRWAKGEGLNERPAARRRATHRQPKPSAPSPTNGSVEVSSELLPLAEQLRDALISTAAEVEQALPAIKTLVALKRTMENAQALQRIAANLGVQLAEAQDRLSRQAMAVYGEGSLNGR